MKNEMNLLNMFIQEINSKLMERTSWGRNDLKELIKDTKLEILEKLVYEMGSN